jgi:hypothetical protein
VGVPFSITRPTTRVATAVAFGNVTSTGLPVTASVAVVVVVEEPSDPPGGAPGKQAPSATPTVPLNGPATALGETPLLAVIEKLYACPEELGIPYSRPLAGSR